MDSLQMNVPSPPSGGGGGSVTIGSATITVPYGSTSYVGTITDAAVLSTSKILVSHGVYSDTDVNDPDMDLIEFHYENVQTGSFQLEVSSTDRTTIGGDFKFNYLVG